jgi:AraC-like DNA-binding protein
VSEFAGFVAVDRSHLTRVFLHVHGRAPLDVLHERRVLLAQSLLTATSLTTDEIAARTAFGTRNTFYRIFLKRVGMTPDAWRKVTK